MAEITKELGRIPVSRGNYQSTTEYYKDNIVQYKRGSYQVVSESPIIGVPPTNDKNIVNPGWTLFAGTLDAQDVVNQIKEQETKSIQAVADREAEILAKSDAAKVSFDNTGTSLSGTNVQDALKETNGKLSKLESEVIYDVTANNDGATFSSLSALLSSENLSTLIPSKVRYGGMSIRFIQDSKQSSNNNYVQYRYLLASLNPNHFTNMAYWQKEDEDVIVLQGIGVSGVGLLTKVGDCYYNTTQNTIKMCISYTDETHFEDINVAPQENIIYLVDGIPYTFNGSTLISYVKEKNEYSLKRFSQQNFFNEQNDKLFKNIFPFTIPACGVFPIWEPTITGDIYTANNDMYNTKAPLTYNELLAEFFDKYVGYQKDGYTVYKKELGRAITTNSSYPLYEYDFIPQKYNKIVMLSAGMNAEELTAIFGVCFFIKNLMEEHSSDDGLDYLYNNVRFKVVPVINVWGYEQENMQYKTAENININLNWDYNNSWVTQGSTDPDSNFYKGISPFSGQETKILKKWLRDNGHSAELWIDCHTGVGVQNDVSNLKTFYTFASPKSLQDEIIKCQANIISYYQGKGFSPSATSCELGTAYPKTADAFGTYGVKGIMIEQYPNAPGYGGSGATDQSLQNKDVDIANYVLMIRAYILAAIEKKVYTFTHDDIAYMLYQWKLSTFGRDNIDINFPLYTFFHGEPTWAYNRRGTKLIPVIGGTDKVYIVTISDIVIVECYFYNNGSLTKVDADNNGNIIYSTLSGQNGFRVTFRKPDNSGMEYFGIDRTMVEIEINGVAYNANYDFTHHAFKWDGTVVLSTDRARVMSKFINVESGLYTIKLKENFEIVDLFAFNADGSSCQSLSVNNNTFSVPSDKTRIRMSIKKSGNTAIHLIETEGLIEALYKMIE